MGVQNVQGKEDNIDIEKYINKMEEEITKIKERDFIKIKKLNECEIKEMIRKRAIEEYNNFKQGDKT